MSRQAPVPTLIELASGVQIHATCRATTDWESVRRVIESGVPREEAAQLFKIEASTIKTRSLKENWLTPVRVDKLRKELAKRQTELFAATGMTKDVIELKANIWEERSERWKERMAEVVDGALDGVSKGTMKGMIREPKDLKTVMEVARTLTGETKAEDNAPKLAVNIAFLRTNMAPKPVIVDVTEG